MFTLPLGFLMTVGVIIFSLGTASWRMYFNPHAVVIVVGGTLAILIMSSPGHALKSLAFALFDIFRSTRLTRYRRDLQELAQKRSMNGSSRNPLIKYAAELWAQGVEADLFVVLVSQRRDELERRYVDAVQILRNLAKYPPALGMTGTVMGLVSLFSVLGADNKTTLGPSLALAMTATFFGLIVANCVVTPLADHIHVRHMQNEGFYTAIYQILILINRGESPALVDEEVRSRAAA